MTPAETLRRARALIERPEAWTKAADARLEDGRATLATSPNAVCWCSVGAIEAAVSPGGYRPRLYHEATEFFRSAAGGPPRITFWNDAPERTHADVLAAFDRAIEAAEEEEVGK